MEPFNSHTGVGVPLRRSNTDTDQIVPAEWVALSTRPTSDSSRGERDGYGLQWWTFGESAYSAVGLQGQYIYVDPSTRTVVVKLSHFPPGDEAPSAETAAFLAAASAWNPEAANAR